MGTLSDVTVTARRTTERLQDVPIAITALKGDELERKGITSLYNLQSSVPSLRVATFNNPDTLVVGVRGQRNSQVQPGQDPSIGIYFAEVPTGFQIGLNVGLFDLEDIQVLKGPQGTLFGRNSTGGAVLLNPAKPKVDKVDGYVKVGGVHFDEGDGYTAQAVLNLPLGDTLAARFGIDVVDRDGYIKNIAGGQQIPELIASPRGLSNLDNLGDQESQVWRAGLQWAPNDVFSNYTVYQGVHYRSDNGVNPTLTAVNPTFPLKNNIPSITTWLPQFLSDTQNAQKSYFWTTMSGSQAFVTVDSHLLYNTSTIDVGGVTLKNIAGYKYLKSTRFQDSIGIPYELIQSYYDPQRGHEFSEEFQVQGTAFDSALKWVGGLFYFDNTYDSGTDPSIQLATPGLAIPLNYVAPSARIAWTESKTKAVFAQGTYNFPSMEKLSLTVGARYTWDQRDMTVTNYTNTTFCGLYDANGVRLPLSDCFYDGSKKFSEPTWLGSLDYKFTPTTLGYVSVARGYRAGGFNIGSATPTAFQAFQPEFVTNYELGFKKDWHLGLVGLRTNAAVFYQDYKDIQRIAQDTRAGVVSAARLFNATAAELKGGELEVSAAMGPVDLSLGYSYVNPKYTEDFYTSAPGGGQQNVALNTFSQVPRNTFNAGITYSIATPPSVGELALSADYAYQSRYYYDDVAQGALYGDIDSQSMKGFGITNARVDLRSVAGSKFDLDFRVTNLFDRKYYSSAVPVYASIGTWSAFVGQPRFYWLEAKYSFGK